MPDGIITILDENDKSELETSIDNHVKTHWIKTYTNLGQIGLTEGSETIEDIATSLPANARLVFPVGVTNADVYPAPLGTLIVDRINDSRVALQFYKKDADRFWFGVYASDNSSPWIGWSEVYNERHNPTAADVGAVSKTGDTMTGALRVENDSYPKIRFKATNDEGISMVEGSSTGIGLLALDTENNNSTMRAIYLRDGSTSATKDSLILVDKIDGVENKYAIYGAHNKPSATAIQTGSFPDKVLASMEASAATSTAQVRNIYFGTSDMTAGSTGLPSGYIYIKYKA